MVFRELFYALPRRENAMMFLKFEDTASKTVFFKHNFTTSAGHFCFEIFAKKVAREKIKFSRVSFQNCSRPFFFLPVKIGPIDHACFHAQF